MGEGCAFGHQIACERFVEGNLFKKEKKKGERKNCYKEIQFNKLEFLEEM